VQPPCKMMEAVQACSLWVAAAFCPQHRAAERSKVYR
jgi:hypothetical protein